MAQQSSGCVPQPSALYSRNVEALGQAGDIVSVDRVRARHQLIPTRAANYLPTDRRGRPIFPKSYVEHPQHAKLAPTSSAASKLQNAEERAHRSSEAVAKMRSLPLPALIFRRAPRANSSYFFGSVTVGDVLTELRLRHNVGLYPEDSKATFNVRNRPDKVADRVRQFGSHDVTFTVRGDQVTLTIVVEPDLKVEKRLVD
ncbi:hypothetical protein HDU93_007365 [Gonapodya sp. JEL0774]|nr:hypothetical protein HDU93_007365 [Gonapodya sp. JEL0774]